MNDDTMRCRLIFTTVNYHRPDITVNGTFEECIRIARRLSRGELWIIITTINDSRIVIAESKTGGLRS